MKFYLGKDFGWFGQRWIEIQDPIVSSKLSVNLRRPENEAFSLIKKSRDFYDPMRIVEASASCNQKKMVNACSNYYFFFSIFCQEPHLGSLKLNLRSGQEVRLKAIQ